MAVLKSHAVPVTCPVTRVTQRHWDLGFEPPAWPLRSCYPRLSAVATSKTHLTAERHSPSYLLTDGVG